VQQRAGNAVLHAEFGLKRVARIGTVGVRQPARRRPRIDARHRGCIERAVLAHQVQRRLDGSVRAVAARVLFVTRAGLNDVERRAPALKYAGRVKVAGPVENVEKALFMLERVGICRETLARQQRRHQSAARALPDMQRLGHRPEVGLRARRERGAQRKRRFGFSNRQV